MAAKKKPKVCKYCGETYHGHPVSQYCEKHKDPRTRVASDVKDGSCDCNMEYKHSYKDITTVKFVCGLEGCGKTFAVDVIPKQYIYPKYCPDHRSEHRRKMFEKSKK